MNKKIVIKIGSSLVASESNVVEVNFIRKISFQIKELINLGYEIILVSSGAIACGMKLWKLDQRPQQIEKLLGLRLNRRAHGFQLALQAVLKPLLVTLQHWLLILPST